MVDMNTGIYTHTSLANSIIIIALLIIPETTVAQLCVYTPTCTCMDLSERSS